MLSDKNTIEYEVPPLSNVTQHPWAWQYAGSSIIDHTCHLLDNLVTGIDIILLYMFVYHIFMTSPLCLAVVPECL